MQQQPHSMKKANAALRRALVAALQAGPTGLQAVQTKHETRCRLPAYQLSQTCEARVPQRYPWGVVSARQPGGAAALMLVQPFVEQDTRRPASTIMLPCRGAQQHISLEEMLRTVCATTQTPLRGSSSSSAHANLRRGGADELVQCAVRAVVMPAGDSGAPTYCVGIGRSAAGSYPGGTETAVLVIVCTKWGTSVRVCHHDESPAVCVDVRGEAHYLRASADELHGRGPAPVCVVQVPVRVKWTEECDFAIGAPLTRLHVDGSDDVEYVMRNDVDVLVTQLLCFVAGADGSLPQDFVAAADQRIAIAERAGPSLPPPASNRREQ